MLWYCPYASHKGTNLTRAAQCDDLSPHNHRENNDILVWRVDKDIIFRIFNSYQLLHVKPQRRLKHRSIQARQILQSVIGADTVNRVDYDDEEVFITDMLNKIIFDQFSTTVVRNISPFTLLNTATRAIRVSRRQPLLTTEQRRQLSEHDVISHLR
ncbi:hypothetical protein CHS0354_011262 [Potamilus streckersoni]|uniref:Uncharacterized protein n=1 Tax=Potamilus streckersoni TaxID=2493646 RepID=A0AAE0VGB6_9BIVA|nr:hypothetical protein CHS0354_011262 [Potamilus streckersoni]